MAGLVVQQRKRPPDDRVAQRAEPACRAVRLVLQPRPEEVDEEGVNKPSSWGGYGGFGKFAESVASDTLQVSGPHPPGYLLDPRRHDPLEPGEPRDPLPASVAGLAHRVARIVGVPELTPRAYRVLFEELARLSAQGPVTDSLNMVESKIRDGCVARGARVTRSAVHFVLQGFHSAGVDWQSAGRQASVLAEGFADNVTRLCLNARMELTGDETARLRSWIAESG